MGEIRSTLDIIMERAAGLTVTEEEKQEFKEREMSGKLKGLVQKFMDRALSLDRFRVEMGALEEKNKTLAHGLLREEALEHMVAGQENGAVLEILKSIVGMDVGPLEEALSAHDRKVRQERERMEKVLMEKYEKRGISGSAARPNVAADPEWIGVLAKETEIFREKISSSTR